MRIFQGRCRAFAAVQISFHVRFAAGLGRKRPLRDAFASSTFRRIASSAVLRFPVAVENLTLFSWRIIAHSSDCRL